MATLPESISMAVFCDFENVALGVRDANYEKFDIKRVLERLLLKGSIVVKKAYCDWERYKSFKSVMHEANFELIEIPHLRQSGKNSADIRLVVDALDLCYTKSHVDTFVIISGDSDFSPLVSKLRENAKQVIGVGVKRSTSDLLIANCDEFIFYDDLVRDSQRAARREAQEAQPQQAARRSPEEEKRRREELEARRRHAIDIAVETFDALAAERGDTGRIWASMLKEAIKRRKPDFNESYFGFRAFGNLLEEAQSRGLLELGRDEKSGTYVYRGNGAAEAAARGEEAPPKPQRAAEAVAEGRAEKPAAPSGAEQPAGAGTQAAVPRAERPRSRRRGEGGRKAAEHGRPAAAAEAAPGEAAQPPAVVAAEVRSAPEPEVVPAEPAAAAERPTEEAAAPAAAEPPAAAPQEPARKRRSRTRAGAVEEAPAPKTERQAAPKRPRTSKGGQGRGGVEAAETTATEAEMSPAAAQVALPLGGEAAEDPQKKTPAPRRRTRKAAPPPEPG
jgi:uncharacterized protein (TIGR00288 family)